MYGIHATVSERSDSRSDGILAHVSSTCRSGVLKHLVHCGQFKWPAGIMGKVLRFFGGLLADIKQVNPNNCLLLTLF